MFMLNELLIKDLSEKVEINTSDIQSIKDAEVYSTSEVKTNKIWINGKPIYRKTVSGSIANSISHNLTNVNFVNAYGYVASSSGAFLVLPSLRITNSNFSIGFYVNSESIIFEKGSSASGTAYITLEYTKTTD